MIILDTNVLSELMRASPSKRAVAWVDAQPTADLFVTSISQAAVLYGLELLPPGKRRDALVRLARSLFETDFEGRVLPFAEAAAGHFAQIAASRRRAGRPISAFDAQIAAIVRLHDATLATRNVADFENCSIDLIDPWSAD